MATNKRELKAFVRIDGSGRNVPTSLILRKSKPKIGRWVEVTAYECCNESTTTTSSTLVPQLCVTYGVTIGTRGGTVSFTSCEGMPIGPLIYIEPIETTFCALIGTLELTGNASAVLLSYTCEEGEQN
jgi:hypothetical protein